MQKGRLFENAVSLIEQCLETNKDTVVKHDVKLTDQLGIERQIDVYITSEINGHPINIALECKEHKAKIKLNHIDDFDSKTKRLAIDKRIYVSKAGYQSGAIKAAKALGIELCTLSDLSEETIKSWIRVPGLQSINQIYNFLHIRFNLEKSAESVVMQGKFDIENSIYLNDRATSININVLRQNLVNQLGQKLPNEFVPDTEKKIIFNFLIGDSYYLRIKGSFYRIETIEAIVHFQLQEQLYPISSVKQYSKVDGKNLAKVATIEFPAMSQEFILSFIKSEKDGLTRIVVSPKRSN